MRLAAYRTALPGMGLRSMCGVPGMSAEGLVPGMACRRVAAVAQRVAGVPGMAATVPHPHEHHRKESQRTEQQEQLVHGLWLEYSACGAARIVRIERHTGTPA
jgi:hypothetical protein